jgi:hypothetical protein
MRPASTRAGDRRSDGRGRDEGIKLEPSFYYTPVWSPDAGRIAFSDKRLNLWYVDVAKGTPIKVDTDYYEARSSMPRGRPTASGLRTESCRTTACRLHLFGRSEEGVPGDRRR